MGEGRHVASRSAPAAPGRARLLRRGRRAARRPRRPVDAAVRSRSTARTARWSRGSCSVTRDGPARGDRGVGRARSYAGRDGGAGAALTRAHGRRRPDAPHPPVWGMWVDGRGTGPRGCAPTLVRWRLRGGGRGARAVPRERRLGSGSAASRCAQLGRTGGRPRTGRARSRMSCRRPAGPPGAPTSVREAGGPIWRGVTLSYALLQRIYQWDFALREPLTAPLVRCARPGEARGEAL